MLHLLSVKTDENIFFNRKCFMFCFCIYSLLFFVKYTPIYHIFQDLFTFPNCDVIPVNKKEGGVFFSKNCLIGYVTGFD